MLRSSVIRLLLSFKLFSLQLVCVSAVTLNILRLHQLSLTNKKSEIVLILVHQTDSDLDCFVAWKASIY